MSTITFRAGYSYLVKDRFKKNWSDNSVLKVKILSVTDTCYEIQFDKEDKKFVEKDKFRYIIIEELKNELSDFVKNFI